MQGSADHPIVQRDSNRPISVPWLSDWRVTFPPVPDVGNPKTRPSGGAARSQSVSLGRQSATGRPATTDPGPGATPRVSRHLPHVSALPSLLSWYCAYVRCILSPGFPAMVALMPMDYGGRSQSLGVLGNHGTTTRSTSSSRTNVDIARQGSWISCDVTNRVAAHRCHRIHERPVASAAISLGASQPIT